MTIPSDVGAKGAGGGVVGEGGAAENPEEPDDGRGGHCATRMLFKASMICRGVAVFLEKT